MKVNKLYFSNCIRLMRDVILSESIDFIYADPPYDVKDPQYVRFTKKWILAAKNVLKSDGAMVVSCTQVNLAECLTALKESEFEIRNVLVWEKIRMPPMRSNKYLTQTAEFMILAAKSSEWTYDVEALRATSTERDREGNPRLTRGVWGVSPASYTEKLRTKTGEVLHPDQKPEALLLKIIAGFTSYGDLVLDPFVGTGTSIYVARKLGRQWIGIESNPTYCKFARRRMALKAMKNKKEVIS